MEPVDVTGLTFGFKASSSAAERRRRLLFMRWATTFRRGWPLLRFVIGIALFFGTLFANGIPKVGSFLLAIGVLFLWLAILWAFSGRYRLAALDVPEALAKQLPRGAVLARMIVTEVRPLLDDSVLRSNLSPNLELLPPLEGEIPGLKISFALVSGLFSRIY